MVGDVAYAGVGVSDIGADGVAVVIRVGVAVDDSVGVGGYGMVCGSADVGGVCVVVGEYVVVGGVGVICVCGSRVGVAVLFVLVVDIMVATVSLSMRYDRGIIVIVSGVSYACVGGSGVIHNVAVEYVPGCVVDTYCVYDVWCGRCCWCRCVVLSCSQLWCQC